MEDDDTQHLLPPQASPRRHQHSHRHSHSHSHQHQHQGQKPRRYEDGGSRREGGARGGKSRRNQHQDPHNISGYSHTSSLYEYDDGDRMATGADEYEEEYNLALVRDAFSSLHTRATRTLALFSLFDGLFCVTLWAVISQGFHGEWKGSNVYNSIVHFTFETSMFDIVCVAVARMVLYIVVYWALKSGRSAFVIVMTSASIAFLLVKLFFFNFSKVDLAYLLFIVAFVLPWIEAYMFMAKIAPLMKKLGLLYGDRTSHQVYPSDVRQMLLERNQGVLVPSTKRRHEYGALQGTGFVGVNSAETPPLLRKHRMTQHQTRTTTSTGGFDAVVGVDDEDDKRYPSNPARLARDALSSQQHIEKEDEEDDAYSLESASHFNRRQEEKRQLRQAQEFDSRSHASSATPHQRYGAANAATNLMMSLARAAADQVEDCALRDVDSNHSQLWTELYNNKQGVIVSSRKMGGSKIFRCQGLVWASPEILFRFLLDDFDQAQEWSSFWDVSKIDRKIDSHTDVMHIGLKKQGILNSKRDLAVVRYWRHYSNNYTLVFRSVRDPLLPPRRNVTRVEDNGSGFYLQRVPKQSHLTKLTFVFNMDLKTSFISSERRVVSILRVLHDEIRLALEQRAEAQQHSVGKHNFV